MSDLTGFPGEDDTPQKRKQPQIARNKTIFNCFMFFILIMIVWSIASQFLDSSFKDVHPSPRQIGSIVVLVIALVIFGLSFLSPGNTNYELNKIQYIIVRVFSTLSLLSISWIISQDPGDKNDEKFYDIISIVLLIILLIFYAMATISFWYRSPLMSTDTWMTDVWSGRYSLLGRLIFLGQIASIIVCFVKAGSLSTRAHIDPDSVGVLISTAVAFSVLLVLNIDSQKSFYEKRILSFAHLSLIVLGLCSLFVKDTEKRTKIQNMIKTSTGLILSVMFIMSWDRYKSTKISPE